MKHLPHEPQPVQFEQVNFTYNAPVGMEETCGDLPCFRKKADGKGNAPLAISCWRFPTREQRLKFLRDGIMWMTVLMDGHPPVALSTETPFEQPEDKEPNRASPAPRPKVVIVESATAGRWFWQRWADRRYAIACVSDSLSRGEAPVSTYLIFGRPDLDRKFGRGHIERSTGSIGELAEMTVVYTDRGTTSDMHHGINAAKIDGRAIEYRTLN